MEFPKIPVNVHGESREQPFHSKPPFGFDRMVSTFRNLHLENDGFSEAAMGWTRGLCIQLASIRKKQLTAISCQLPAKPASLGLAES